MVNTVHKSDVREMGTIKRGGMMIQVKDDVCITMNHPPAESPDGDECRMVLRVEDGEILLVEMDCPISVYDSAQIILGGVFVNENPG